MLIYAQFILLISVFFFLSVSKYCFGKISRRRVPTSFLSVFINREHKGTVYFYDSGTWLFSFAVQKNVYYGYKIVFYQERIILGYFTAGDLVFIRILLAVRGLNPIQAWGRSSAVTFSYFSSQKSNQNLNNKRAGCS